MSRSVLRWRTAVLAALLGGGLAGGAGATSGLERVRVEFLPLAGSRSPAIVAEYVGRRYDPPRRLDPAYPRPDALPEERFLLRMMHTIRSGTVQGFANLWEPGERQQVLDFYARTPNLWDQLKRHHQRVTDQRLVNDMHYGDYILLQVLKVPDNFPTYVTTTVLKRHDGQLFLSNDLKGDAVHLYFATEFATRLVEEFNAQRRPPR
jgi:hypothetical protein